MDGKLTRIVLHSSAIGWKSSLPWASTYIWVVNWMCCQKNLNMKINRQCETLRSCKHTCAVTRAHTCTSARAHTHLHAHAHKLTRLPLFIILAPKFIYQTIDNQTPTPKSCFQEPKSTKSRTQHHFQEPTHPQIPRNCSSHQTPRKNQGAQNFPGTCKCNFFIHDNKTLKYNFS